MCAASSRAFDLVLGGRRIELTCVLGYQYIDFPCYISKRWINSCTVGKILSDHQQRNCLNKYAYKHRIIIELQGLHVSVLQKLYRNFPCYI